jgi:hypothetical protein
MKTPTSTVSSVPKRSIPNEAKIADNLPTSNPALAAAVARIPPDQIARTILIAAGRPIPNDPQPILNSQLDIIKTNIKELRKAELTTLEWDVLDPPPVNLVNSTWEKLEILGKSPSSSSKRGPMKIPQTMNPPISQKEGFEKRRFEAVLDSIDPVSLHGQPLAKWPNPSLPKIVTRISDIPKTMVPGYNKAPTHFPSIRNGSSTAPISIPSTNVSSESESHDGAADNLGSKIIHHLTFQKRNLPTPAPYVGQQKGIDAVTVSPTLGANSSAGLGKSMFQRRPKTTPTKVKKSLATKTARKSSVKNTPPLPSAHSTPSRRMTPQVVIISPRRQITPPIAILDDDDYQSPIQTQSTRRNSSRQSTTPRRPTMTKKPLSTPQSTRRQPPVVIPLNNTESSSESPESTPENSPKKSKSPLELGYKSYPCRWDTFSAELHSFDTLEQHVLKVHGKPDRKEKVRPLPLFLSDFSYLVDIILFMGGLLFFNERSKRIF